MNLRCDIDEMAVSKNEKSHLRDGDLINGFFYINLLSGELFPSAMGKMALPIAGCGNSKRLILCYYISINSLKMEWIGGLEWGEMERLDSFDKDINGQVMLLDIFRYCFSHIVAVFI